MIIFTGMSTQTAHLPTTLTAPSPRRFWRKIGRALAAIPFADDIVAAYLCAMDRTTPTYVRAVLLGAVAYFVLPADMIPDLLVGLGYTDDASVVAAAMAAVGGHLRPAHREEAHRRLDELRRTA